ncbi:MAG: hypothetical protein AB1791_18070 [Chloroflexota bacterium]
MSSEQKAAGRTILNLILFVIGAILSVSSLAAEVLGLDLTPGFGMVQMFQLLVGLTFLTAAGFLHMRSLRPPGSPRSLQADVGIRLALTGLVFAFVSGLSDLIGIGTHVQPAFARPFVGPLQLGGLLLGIVSITAGMLLYHTSRGHRPVSSLQSLLPSAESAERPPDLSISEGRSVERVG